MAAMTAACGPALTRPRRSMGAHVFVSPKDRLDRSLSETLSVNCDCGWICFWRVLTGISGGGYVDGSFNVDVSPDSNYVCGTDVVGVIKDAQAQVAQEWASQMNGRNLPGDDMLSEARKAAGLD